MWSARNGGGCSRRSSCCAASPRRRPTIAIEQGALRLSGGAPEPCSLWLVAFDRAQDVAIGRGENRGQTLRYHNVVREISGLGDWDGTALTLPLPLERLAAERRDGAAVLVQRKADGAILTARRIDLAPG